MALSWVSGPDAEPIDLATAMKQIRQDVQDDQEFVRDVLIPAVRGRAEVATRRAVAGAQTFDYWLDAFPRERVIEIPMPPLVSVTYVKYVDMGGVLRTLTVNTDYVVDAPAGERCSRGRVALPFGSIWPVTLPQINAVVVRFVAGYGDPTDTAPTLTPLPGLLRSGMLMDLGALYENRESINVDTRGTAVPLPVFAHWIYTAFKSHPTQRLDRVR